MHASLATCNVKELVAYTYKVRKVRTHTLSGKYYTLVSPTLTRASSCTTRGNDLQLQKKIDLNTICINTVSATGLLTHGIAYPMLFLLSLLIHLRIDLISSGMFKRLFMILKHSWKEPEVEVQ